MNNSSKDQRGVVLLVSLVLLLLLTIIAITAASTATLQQRMANNAQESNRAFQAAESGLSNWITLFNSPSSIIPTGPQPTGTDTSAWYSLTGGVQANCLAGSLSVNGPFEYTCHHITSEGATDTNARSRHQMGYLVRKGL